VKVFVASTKASADLGAIIGRGGEGTVYEIAGSPKYVAKLYAEEPTSEKVSKLIAMIKVGDEGLLKIAGWPTDLITDSRGKVKGFVMPRIASRADVHELYSPKGRAQEFPESDFRFVVHVATNICRAIGRVHQYGLVVGDINHGSVLVGREGTAILIDCDSMQIRDGDRVYTCDVGVPLFTPPELHDKPFRGMHRTANHDAFGLAILVFQLLFMGRHPFAGRYLGRGDMSIEQAIREFRFAYGADRRMNQMEVPPHTVTLTAMGAPIAEQFEQAFGRTGPTRRPTALDWIAALGALGKSLKLCAANATHYFPAAAASCPWCPIEQATYVRLFGQRLVATGSTGTVGLQELWAAIAGVKGPGPAPPLPVSIPPSNHLRRAVVGIRQLGTWAVAIAGLILWAEMEKGIWAVMGFVAAYYIWPRPSEAARAALRDAERRWTETHSEWERQASDGRFVDRRRELEATKNELANFPNERARRLQKLKQDRETLQRNAYLDRFRLDRASIPLIGEARVTMLASYGIETAADVERSRVSSIPGFGERLTDNLIAWRREHEKNFRFNPNEPVDPKAIAEVERDLQARQAQLIAELRRGPGQLRQIETEIMRARAQLQPGMEEAWRAKSLAAEQARV
jgi:DNA-binding helix-hairpin-helix protein with protein kinase domain